MKAKKVFALALAAALTISGTGVLYAAPESGAAENIQTEGGNSEGTEPEDVQTEDKKPEGTEPEDVQTEDKKPEGTEPKTENNTDAEDVQGENTPQNSSQGEDAQKTNAVPEDQVKQENAKSSADKQIEGSAENSVQAKSTQGDLVRDQWLAEAIRITLSLEESEPITKEVLEELDWLYCSGVDSLEGLEYAVNLTNFASNNGQLTDLTPLTGLEKLTYIDVSGNHITEIPSLSRLTSLNGLMITDNPVSKIAEDVRSSDILISLSAEAPVAEEIFRDYISFEPVKLMENSGIYYANPVSSHFLIYDMDFSAQENTAFQVENNYSGFRIEALGSGTGTVVAKVGDTTKEIPVTISPMETEVEENENIHTLPQLTDTNSDMLLYDGQIWDLSGEMAETVPSERKVTNYVSCKVYYGNQVLWDMTVLDENSTLYYWPVNAETGAYESEVRVADNVQTITPNGYIDSAGAYHYWEYQYEEGEERPQELRVIQGVDHVSENYVYLEDGSALSFINAGSFIEQSYDLETPIREVKGQYILDIEGVLWKTAGEDYEKAADQVTDFSPGGHYISQKILYSADGQVLDTEVDSIEQTGNGTCYVKGNDYYLINYDDTTQLYARNVKSFLDNLFLLNDGTLWVDGTANGYQILTSVEKISGGDGNKYNVLRKDGSVWRVSPPLAPYMIFQAAEGPDSPEEILWNKADEATGITATAQGIPDSVNLQVSAVTENSETYGEDYAQIRDHISALGGTNLMIYDIKLLDQAGEVYQPEEGNMVTVSVPKPENFQGTAKVYHQNTDKSLTELAAVSEEGAIIFQTPGFSLFAIADFSSEGSDNPQDPGSVQDPQDNKDPGSAQEPQDNKDPGSTQNTENGKNNPSDNTQVTKTGTAVTKGTAVKGGDSVKTGDEAPVLLYGGLAIAGILVLSSVGIYRRKKR